MIPLVVGRVSISGLEKPFISRDFGGLTAVHLICAILRDCRRIEVWGAISYAPLDARGTLTAGARSI